MKFREVKRINPKSKIQVFDDKLGINYCSLQTFKDSSMPEGMPYICVADYIFPVWDGIDNMNIEGAIELQGTNEFAYSSTAVDLALITPSEFPQQFTTTPAVANDVWSYFTAVGVNYVRPWGLNDFDAVIEVYDSHDGSLVFSQNAEPEGEREEGTLNMLIPGRRYYWRTYSVFPNTVETNITIAVSYIPRTQLSADDSNIFDYADGDLITTDLPVNQFLLTSWEFRFTELEAPYRQINILSPNGANPNFFINWFLNATTLNLTNFEGNPVTVNGESGRTYCVQTRARMYRGLEWGEFAGGRVIGLA